MKQVVIVHGYKARPETNWKPWLKAKLEDNGFRVEVPAMPNTEHPVASEWSAKLLETVGQPTANTYLVGHSLGGITILRYLESLGENQSIGGCVLVAGFGEKFEKYQGGHDSFFDHELDWRKIKAHCPRFIAIHSDDDPGVDPKQLELFKQKLDAKTIMMHGMGHFASADNVFEVPVVFEELLTLSKE
jgi:predicted alpha/beta hydrolase family esterase